MEDVLDIQLDFQIIETKEKREKREKKEKKEQKRQNEKREKNEPRNIILPQGKLFNLSDKVIRDAIIITSEKKTKVLTKVLKFKESLIALKKKHTRPHIHLFFDYSSVKDYISELSDINNILEFTDRLWVLDSNRLEIGKDLILNIGDRLQIRSKEFKYQEKLIPYLDKKFFELPTFKALIEIFNDFDPVLQHKRQSLKSEKDEHINNFLNEIKKTDVIILLHKYLLKCKLTKSFSIDEFIEELKYYWFKYHNNENEACLFQHIFLGQIKESRNMVTGYHNWIKYYFDQENDEIDFAGHLYSELDPLLDSNIGKNDYYLNLRFFWRGLEKHIDGFLIGTSPEYDFAVSTLAFYIGKKDLCVHVNGFEMHMNTFFKENSEFESLIATTYVSN